MSKNRFSQLPSLIADQFSSSAKAVRSTQTLTLTGMLLAVQIVLSSYGVIEVSDSLKISLAHLAIAPTAMLFGPVVAMAQGALSDIVGYIIKPTGPYFPGFTLSALLLGLVYGVMFYKTERKLWQIIVARLVVIVCINILLNTVFLCMLYGPSRLATLPVRAFKNIIQLPIDVILLSFVTRVVQRMPKRILNR